MDRLQPPTRRVAIALTVTVMTVIGCQRSAELAHNPEQNSAASAAPHHFQAPDNVRPMAQLAAHLSISETHENIVKNPHVLPQRIPPVTAPTTEPQPSPLENIRFPLMIEKSAQPEESIPSEEPWSRDTVPSRQSAEPPAEFTTAQTPLSLNPPTTTPATPSASGPTDLSQKAVTRSLPPSLELPMELSPRVETKTPEPAPTPASTKKIEPNFLRDLPPAGRFTQDIAQPHEVPAESPRPSVTGPPASFVSLAPLTPPSNRELPPARKVIEDIQGPGLEVPARTPEISPTLQPVKPPRQAPPELDHALIAVRGRMNSLVDHGLVLAQRGAYFSARAEFIQALRLATQTLDTAERTHRHSDALAEAVAALDEAGDFIPSGARLEANVDLDLVVSSHRTPVLKGQDLQRETTLTATQKYFSYAQEKLIVACGNLPETSRALVGLGRIQEHLYRTTGDNRTLIGPRSIALYQTALAVDKQNFEAANELGVLLARYGQFDEAKQVLLQGVQASPRPEIWQNLASIHATLGEGEMARRAHQEASMAQQFAQLNGDLNAVRWVTPEEMARHGQADVNLKQSVPSDNIPPIAQRRTKQSTR